MSLRVSDAHVPAVNFEKGAAGVSAGQGRATLQLGRYCSEPERTSSERDKSICRQQWEDFGRTPASLQIAGKAPDLEKLTAGDHLLA